MKMPGESANAAVRCLGEDVCIGGGGVQELIDTFDRPRQAFAAGTYAGKGTFAEAFQKEQGKRLRKAGVYAAAGVGYARAEWRAFDAEAKGPNASAGVGASVTSLSARAFAKAEVASASASAGPVKATVGLAADTGISISLTGLEVKLLGTGFSFGRKISIALLGNEIEFSL